MQKPRRRRRLEFYLLSLSGVVLAACAGAARSESSSPNVSVESSRQLSAPEATGFQSANAFARGAQGLAKPSQMNTSSTQAATAPIPALQEPARNSELPRGTLILHIGDSFAGALGVPLAKRLKAAGLRNILEFKTSSYIPSWAFGPELKKYVANYNPDLVLITLGANEIEIADPSLRAGAIRRLIATVGKKPCVWISPPLWKPDTGLLGVIRQNAAPCRYLDSDSIVSELPRGPDKIHPSTEGREIWADAVFTWLTASRDPSGGSVWALRPENAAP
jgi:lysophospholipase L1-like esterase